MTIFEIFIIIVILIIAGAVFEARMNSEKVETKGKELNEKIATLKDFVQSFSVRGLNNTYAFLVDDVHKQVAYVSPYYKRIIPYNQIISVEKLEEGKTVSQKSTMRTVGGALVGGAIGGGVGAIVGGLSGSSSESKKVSSVQVKIRVRDVNSPSFTINTFDAKTMTVEGKPIKESSMEGYIYRQGRSDADRIVDMVSVIIDEVDKTDTTSNNSPSLSSATSVADELKKLAELAKEGVLSDAEFEEQKAKLLK